MRIIIFLIYIFLFFLPAISKAQTCPVSCNTEEACKREFFIGMKKINYYSNFPLNQSNSCINKIIFVVHGTERNALIKYFAILNAAKTMGKENSVLIISPFFKTSDDHPDNNDYYWSEPGWKKGDESIDRGTQISSFAAADAMLDHVITSTLFPLLAQVSVTGHSAGGQYSQLYALTTTNPDKHSHLSYQFLILNPSNYSYFYNLRPNPTDAGFFEQPVYWNGHAWKMKPQYEEEAGDCPTTYNNYKFGLENRNSYANQFPVADLIAQFIKRKVYYFLGDLDTNPNDPLLDTTCPAKLQGPYRFKRGQHFYHFLNQYFPGNQHQMVIVPGVGHDGSAMYHSAAVKAVLFN